MQVQKFTGYQKFLVAVLAFLQFTIVLDFMILAPLGAILMPALDISNAQFGIVVSAYAFSAGASGLFAAGFADRFDRKRLLLFFYVGFLLGTLFCGLAPSYPYLLGARIVTGLFGGVIGSIVLSIITDLFPYEMRGRVMGFVQTAFAASQILGIPVGLYFSNVWGWHFPFFMIVAIGVLVGIVIAFRLQPINLHLNLKTESTPLKHFSETISNPRYLLAFLFMALLSMGGFMIMPFGSKFTVGNMGIPVQHLPVIYWVTGLCTIITGPLIGRASDRYGKLQTFIFGTVVTIIMVAIYTNLGVTSLGAAIAVNSFLFVGIFSRMIPAQAFLSAIPDAHTRGSFMAISSSLQQMSGGVAAMIAGLIVQDTADGKIEHFDTLGYILIATAVVNAFIMQRLDQKALKNS